MWYDITHPYNGAVMRLASTDVLHYKGYTRDGPHSLSVLRLGLSGDRGGAGCPGLPGALLLQRRATLRGFVHGGGPGRLCQGQGGEAHGRDPERCAAAGVGPDPQRPGQRLPGGHPGPRADLHPLSATMADAKFVENHDITVIDICNFFGVPGLQGERREAELQLQRAERH